MEDDTEDDYEPSTEEEEEAESNLGRGGSDPPVRNNEAPQQQLHQDFCHNTLEFVLNRFGESTTFTDFFSSLWSLFAQSYVEGWVAPMDWFVPVNGTTSVTVVSYETSEEESLHWLRTAVYDFLRALCSRPSSIAAIEYQEERIESRARKIQIPFVKLICYVAWHSQGNLSAAVPFDSPIVVAHIQDLNMFHSSCIVCPKLDRLESTAKFDLAAHKASMHLLSFHQRPKMPFRRLVVKFRARSEMGLTVEQYLIKLQMNIAATSRALSLLDLKDEAHWFQRSVPERRRRRRRRRTFLRHARFLSHVSA